MSHVRKKPSAAANVAPHQYKTTWKYWSFFAVFALFSVRPYANKIRAYFEIHARPGLPSTATASINMCLFEPIRSKAPQAVCLRCIDYLK